MATILKVDEWKGGSTLWYVADVHTWTGWREIADVFGIDDLENFKNYLVKKYDAIIDGYYPNRDFLMFHWTNNNYKKAHQFKLDVNRIARKKNYLVERSF